MPTWLRRPPAGGPRLVHVSARGGVADLLRGLIPAQIEAGTPASWAVIAGSTEFFATAGYLRRLLHDRADPAGLTDAGLARYRVALAPQARWLAAHLDPAAVVVLHDLATLGLAPALAGTGARVVWHCHPGAVPGATRGPAAVWREFAPELSTVDAVATAAGFAAPPAPRRHVYRPAVDPRSPRNLPLTREQVDDLLARNGLSYPKSGTGSAVEQQGPLPAGARVVLHVASWDPLANLPALLGTLPLLPADVHLVLAGPDPARTPAEPDGLTVLHQVRAVIAAMSIVDRLRVHLVLAPEPEPDRGLLLNAVQRRADVLLQAGISDGFGLTVPEAMAKRRALVLADAPGLGQQFTATDTGLRADPTHRGAVAAALRILLDDPPLRRGLGDRAAAAAATRYALPRLVADYQAFAAPRAAPSLGVPVPH